MLIFGFHNTSAQRVRRHDRPKYFHLLNVQNILDLFLLNNYVSSKIILFLLNCMAEFQKATG